MGSWDVVTRSGRLELLQPRVYGVVGAPDSWRRRVLAAVLACGEGAVASHRTAAYLHRFLDIRRPHRIEVLLPRGRTQRPPGIEVHTATELPDDHLTRIGPVPVTAVDRTVCDIRADIPVGHLRRIVHDLWRTGRTTPARIGSSLRDMGRVNHKRDLKRILEDCDPRIARTFSVPESEGFHLLQQSHVRPLPEVNHPVERAEGGTFYLDLAWPTLFLAIEIDSRLYHWTPVDLVHDARRQEELEGVGWTILRIPVAIILHHPEGFVRRVEQALATFQ